jgi:transposase
LSVRRFFCDNTACPRRTFVEQPMDLTQRHARRTSTLARMLTAVAIALGGRAGARLADVLGMNTGRDSLLRLLRALPDPAVGNPTVIGVDDFALRRGHHYATVVIDTSTGRPLDLLPERTSTVLAAWLRAHPGVQIICRDRAGSYAEGARLGAPDAVQVADRWHLWHNLITAVDKTVAANRAVLTVSAPPGQDAPHTPSGTTDPGDGPEGALARRTRERHQQVQARLSAGESISGISRALHLDRRTVRRFARAGDPARLTGPRAAMPSLLDPFKPYLLERFTHGRTDAGALTREITALGYRGSERTVRSWLHPFRAGLPAPTTPPKPPTVREVTSWLTRHPDRLGEEEHLALKAVLDRSPVLSTTAQQVRAFAQILTERQGQRLRAWMADVQAGGAPAMRSFANGLRTDLDAVTAGLTLPHNSGPVEGTVNKIKMIKRQMYGRANLDLLRIRVLHAA